MKISTIKKIKSFLRHSNQSLRSIGNIVFPNAVNFSFFRKSILIFIFVFAISSFVTSVQNIDLALAEGNLNDGQCSPHGVLDNGYIVPDLPDCAPDQIDLNVLPSLPSLRVDSNFRSIGELNVGIENYTNPKHLEESIGGKDEAGVENTANLYCTDQGFDVAFKYEVENTSGSFYKNAGGAWSLDSNGIIINYIKCGSNTNMYVQGYVDVSSLSGEETRMVVADSTGRLNTTEIVSDFGHDNLGNHIAEQNIVLDGHYISGDGSNQGITMISGENTVDFKDVEMFTNNGLNVGVTRLFTIIKDSIPVGLESGATNQEINETAEAYCVFKGYSGFKNYITVYNANTGGEAYQYFNGTSWQAGDTERPFNEITYIECFKYVDVFISSLVGSKADRLAGNENNKVVISTANGILATTDFPEGADNLGNHIATQNIDLDGWAIEDGYGSVYFDDNTLNVSGNGMYLENGSIKLDAFTSSLGTTRMVVTDDSGILATQDMPDPPDNLGNHIATQNIDLGQYWLSPDGDNGGLAVDDNNNLIANKGLTIGERVYDNPQVDVDGTLYKIGSDVSLGDAAEWFCIQQGFDDGVFTEYPTTQYPVATNDEYYVEWVVSDSNVEAIESVTCYTNSNSMKVKSFEGSGNRLVFANEDGVLMTSDISLGDGTGVGGWDHIATKDIVMNDHRIIGTVATSDHNIHFDSGTGDVAVEGGVSVSDLAGGGNRIVYATSDGHLGTVGISATDGVIESMGTGIKFTERNENMDQETGYICVFDQFYLDQLDPELPYAHLCTQEEIDKQYQWETIDTILPTQENMYITLTYFSTYIGDNNNRFIFHHANTPPSIIDGFFDSTTLNYTPPPDGNIIFSDGTNIETIYYNESGESPGNLRTNIRMYENSLHELMQGDLTKIEVQTMVAHRDGIGMYYDYYFTITFSGYEMSPGSLTEASQFIRSVQFTEEDIDSSAFDALEQGHQWVTIKTVQPSVVGNYMNLDDIKVNILRPRYQEYPITSRVVVYYDNRDPQFVLLNGVAPAYVDMNNLGLFLQDNITRVEVQFYFDENARNHATSELIPLSSVWDFVYNIDLYGHEVSPNMNGGGLFTDNLGNHIAEENLQMNGHWVSYEGNDEGILVNEDSGIEISNDLSIGITAPINNPIHDGLPIGWDDVANKVGTLREYCRDNGYTSYMDDYVTAADSGDFYQSVFEEEAEQLTFFNFIQKVFAAGTYNWIQSTGAYTKVTQIRCLKDSTIKIGALASDDYEGKMVVSDQDGMLMTQDIPAPSDWALYGAIQNIKTDNNYISNDGDEEGIYVTATGDTLMTGSTKIGVKRFNNPVKNYNDEDYILAYTSDSSIVLNDTASQFCINNGYNAYNTYAKSSINYTQPINYTAYYEEAEAYKFSIFDIAYAAGNVDWQYSSSGGGTLMTITYIDCIKSTDVYIGSLRSGSAEQLVTVNSAGKLQRQNLNYPYSPVRSNINLNGYYISGDGDNEGIQVNADGVVYANKGLRVTDEYFQFSDVADDGKTTTLNILDQGNTSGQINFTNPGAAGGAYPNGKMLFYGPSANMYQMDAFGVQALNISLRGNTTISDFKVIYPLKNSLYIGSMSDNIVKTSATQYCQEYGYSNYRDYDTEDYGGLYTYYNGSEWVEVDEEAQIINEITCDNYFKLEFMADSSLGSQERIVTVDASGNVSTGATNVLTNPMQENLDLNGFWLSGDGSGKGLKIDGINNARFTNNVTIGQIGADNDFIDWNGLGIGLDIGDLPTLDMDYLVLGYDGTDWYEYRDSSIDFEKLALVVPNYYSGIVVYDITDPNNITYQSYENNLLMSDNTTQKVEGLDFSKDDTDPNNHEYYIIASTRADYSLYDRSIYSVSISVSGGNIVLDEYAGTVKANPYADDLDTCYGITKVPDPNANEFRFVEYCNGGTYVFDMFNWGKFQNYVEWTTPDPNPIKVLSDNDYLYFIYDNYIEKWRSNIDISNSIILSDYSTFEDSLDFTGDYINNVFMDDNYLYVVTDNGDLEIYTTSFNLIDTYNFAEVYFTSVSARNGRVYVGDVDGRIYKFNFNGATISDPEVRNYYPGYEILTIFLGGTTANEEINVIAYDELHIGVYTPALVIDPIGDVVVGKSLSIGMDDGVGTLNVTGQVEIIGGIVANSTIVTPLVDADTIDTNIITNSSGDLVVNGIVDFRGDIKNNYGQVDVTDNMTVSGYVGIGNNLIVSGDTTIDGDIVMNGAATNGIQIGAAGPRILTKKISGTIPSSRLVSHGLTFAKVLGAQCVYRNSSYDGYRTDVSFNDDGSSLSFINGGINGAYRCLITYEP